MRGNEKFAVKEYMESKDKARFVSIAQKLAQHINNLAQDKNTRIRWIWELIQNAKDVPNQFGRCRIRIEIRENKFIFAHNGDPFRVSDLQSIVAQYSSKPEENKTHTQTTGKYGTGFITTYIVSRKVRIKGLLVVNAREDQQTTKDQNDDDSDREVQMVRESDIKKTKKSTIEKKPLKVSKKKIVFSQFSGEDQNLESQIYSEQEEEQSENASNHQNPEGGSLYQRFEVFLDREYKDRDTQFYYKLMRTQHTLIEELQKNEPQPKWQRKQGQLNTQFFYEELDQAAFRMIEEGMNSLKELFPYALLFNPKLFQVQMIDKRKGKRLRNFGIKRLQQSKISNINIFNAQILQQGKEDNIFSLAYLQDQDTCSVVTMPLKIEENNITLLELNHKMPKIFKEFPLIGCKDTGFNFVFTSQYFYPNESRSDLLLKEIQGRNSKKSRSNWESLEMVFKKAQVLYRKLANIATQGQQNLLILTLQNQFTSEQFKDKNFKAIYGQFLHDISDLKFIDFRNDRRGYIKDLICPTGKSLNKKNQQNQYTRKMNSVFSVLLGESNVLNDYQYQRFYPKLIQHRKTWEGLVQYKDLKDCLKILHTMTFTELTYKAGNKDNALNVLENIYEFLQQNNPAFITQGKPKLENEEITNYVLTNKLQFKDLRHPKFPLMKKTKLPKAYCQVANWVNINIDQNLIFDRFTKFFDKTLQFSVATIMDKFYYYFFNFRTNDEKSVPRLIKLGRFLSTFNIESKIFDVASRVKSLSDMCTPFKINDIESELKMDTQMAQELRMLLQYGTLSYLNDQISQNMSLTKMMHLLNINGNDTDQAIEWLNKVYEIQGLLVSKKSNFFEKIGIQQSIIIMYGLAMNQHFYYITNMKVFTYTLHEKCYQGQYPDEDDLEFYSKMRQIQNKNRPIINNSFQLFPLKTKEQGQMPVPVLEETILHQQIRFKHPAITTFKGKFSFTVKLYDQLSTENKVYYIEYLDKCIQKAQKDPNLKFKLELFQPIIERMYYDYASETKCLKRPEDRQFMFYLLKHPEEISLARQIHETTGLREGVKKLKSEDADKNKEKGKQSSNASYFK